MSDEFRHEQLHQQLAEAREVIRELQSQSVAAVPGDEDVSHLRLTRADVALQTSERLLRQLLEGNIVGVIVADDQQVIEANGAFLEMLGHTPTEPNTNIPWGDILDSDEARRIGAVARQLREHERAKPFEAEFLNKDGSSVPVLVGAAHMANDPFRWIAFAIDISTQKSAEKNLEDLNEHLEAEVESRTRELERRARQLRRLAERVTDAADQERERIAELLHDDIQQRLAGLKYQLATHFRPGDAVTRDAMRKLGSEIDECVQATRELSREMSPLTLARRGLLTGIRWLAEYMERTYGLEVSVTGGLAEEPGDHTIVSVLFRAARELLFNVHKHSGSVVAQVSVDTTTEGYRVVVEDEGQGFDPERLQDDEFGAGIGLFGLQEQVISLGGMVEIRSKPNDGTSVTIVIPRPEAKDPARDAGAHPSAEPIADPKQSSVTTILIADDHEVVRRGLASLLEKESEFVVIAEVANGREAIRLTSNMNPDIVLMDVGMPEINGIEATRAITRLATGAKVIGLSMHDDPEVVQQMKDAGAVDYVVKTDPPEKLIELLKECRLR